ncbi:MAG: hypothetical protein JXQ90_18190 [Cyclobacteriaceae bacterium]
MCGTKGIENQSELRVFVGTSCEGAKSLESNWIDQNETMKILKIDGSREFKEFFMKAKDSGLIYSSSEYTYAFFRPSLEKFKQQI